VGDWSQGVRLENAKSLIGYWERDYELNLAAAPLPILGRWRSLRFGSACHRKRLVRSAQGALPSSFHVADKTVTGG
jgi:hypothetical protein